MNTSANSDTQRRTSWDEEKLREYLDNHMGEYIAKRASIHGQIEKDPRKFIERHGGSLDVSSISDMEEAIWRYEARAAFIAICPPECTVELAGSALFTKVAVEAEPKTQEMIRRITDLASK